MRQNEWIADQMTRLGMRRRRNQPEAAQRLHNRRDNPIGPDNDEAGRESAVRAALGGNEYCCTRCDVRTDGGRE